MSIFNKNNNSSRRRSTKGFSELNRRTYEAGQSTRMQRVSSNQANNRMTSNSFSGSSRSSSSLGNSPNNANNNNIYSRSEIRNRYAEKRKKTIRNKRIKIIAAVIGGILVAIIAACVVYANIISSNVNEGMSDIGLTPTSLDKPFYMVLMGIDSSDERKSGGGTDDNFRSDSILLSRIDPVQKKVTLMSLHRDTEINMGQHGKQKLNAAHSLGGPELVIKTVSQLAGVPINHYAEINFDGFKAAVDDLGGVDVNVPMDIHDNYAGGDVPKGQQHLDGEHALILARARHAYDAYGDGDKFRAANQRMILTAIATKALSSDIVTIAHTVMDLSKYIRTDLTINDMVGLAQIMKDIDPNKDVYTAMEPTEGVLQDGIWYEKLDEVKWKKMMERMDKGLPPNEETIIDDATGTVLSTSGDSNTNNSSGSVNYNASVAIRNGTTRDGVASDASNKLYSMGFKTDIGNANSLDYTTTVIVYNNDSQKATADAIQNALGCGKVVKNNNEYVFNTDFLVVIGTDYSS